MHYAVVRQHVHSSGFRSFQVSCPSTWAEWKGGRTDTEEVEKGVAGLSRGVKKKDGQGGGPKRSENLRGLSHPIDGRNLGWARRESHVWWMEICMFARSDDFCLSGMGLENAEQSNNKQGRFCFAFFFLPSHRKKSHTPPFVLPGTRRAGYAVSKTGFQLSDGFLLAAPLSK